MTSKARLLTRIPLLAVLFLASCSPPAVYEVTFTKRHTLRKDEVRTYRVFQVVKKGWLTSDRYHLHLEDGSTVILPGRWEMSGEEVPDGEQE